METHNKSQALRVVMVVSALFMLIAIMLYIDARCNQLQSEIDKLREDTGIIHAK